LLLPALALAQPQSSAHFRLPGSVLDAGGTAASSSNFRLVSAFGQPSPLGFESSANFRHSGGFLAPLFSVSPLSPIQHLVILAQTPNVRLHWPRVPGATQYKVYRSTEPQFTAGAANYLGTAADTTYTDANILGLSPVRNYYIVSAVSGSSAREADPPAAQKAPAGSAVPMRNE
jgi:hypothetical protein